MKVGERYVMQRGPTRNPRKVTLLEKEAPSGASHRVLVRIEDGLSAGKELEAPSQSIQHLPGAKPSKSRRRRKAAPRETVAAPPGWVPTPGEAVAWTQTLGSRCTVVTVDAAKGVAHIRAKVMGMQEEFDAPIAELSPYRQQLTPVPDSDLEKRLDGRLPEKRRAQGSDIQPKPEPVEESDDDEEWIERLIFSPGCISFYRARFAKRSSLQEAARRLRDELRKAEKLRKRHTGEYLRLRVAGRFDAVLKQSPSSGEFQALYVEGLQLPARPKRKKKSSRRKAA